MVAPKLGFYALVGMLDRMADTSTDPLAVYAKLSEYFSQRGRSVRAHRESAQALNGVNELLRNQPED